MKAIWNGQVIAESDDIVKVEGNAYFPEDSLKKEFFEKSPMHTVCPWKGKASYYHLRQEGEKDENAAWYYADPSPEAAEIRSRVAFGHGVSIKK